MLQNMSRRERILALVVAGSLPLLGLLWGVTTFTRTYYARQAKIRELQQQIESENLRQMNAELAQQRRRYYRARSLPTNLNLARIEYDKWLTEIAERRAQMELESTGKGRADNFKVRYPAGNRQVDVYEIVEFKLRGKGTLGQLTTLLTEFYKLDLMHRINGITITPVTKSAGGAGAEILTGQLKIDMDISVVSLVDADREYDFVSQLTSNRREWDEWVQPILARNIFGPANNPPEISQSNRSFETEKPIEISLQGEDPDENDALNFEFLSGDLEGGELEQRGGDRRAVLKFPPQPEGRYEARVRVTDNGFPPKSIEKNIAFNVNPPRREEVRVEPPKPKFKHAQAAVIRAVLQDASGADVCWIEVETTGKSHKVRVGEAFELDEKTWTVRRIEARQVTIQVDDLLNVYKLGGRLDSPLSSRRTSELSSATGDLTPRD